MNPINKNIPHYRKKKIRSFFEIRVESITVNENIEGTENNVSKQKNIYVSLVVFMQTGSDTESDSFY